MNFCVLVQSRVGSRNGFRSGVNTRRCPALGGRSRQGRIGIIRRWFLRGRGGGQGLLRLISESPGFLRISAHPDRCFRRVPPEPPRQQQSLPPPVTEWVLRPVTLPPRMARNKFCCGREVRAARAGIGRDGRSLQENPDSSPLGFVGRKFLARSPKNRDMMGKISGRIERGEKNECAASGGN